MGATFTDQAKLLGQNSADAYWGEFAISPKADGPENVGDWDSDAWGIAWHELRDAGATIRDYDDCLAAWKAGFWI